MAACVLRSVALPVNARRPFLHKGGGAFAVILAVERRRIACRSMLGRPARLDIAAGELVEDRLHPGDRERRVGGHRGGEFDRGVDRVAIDEGVGKPHLAGRRRVMQLAAVEDALGVGEPDRRVEQAALADRVDRAELGRRDAEPGAAAQDAEIATERDRAAAAGARAFDRGDARLRQRADRGIGGRDRRLIGGAAGAVGTHAGELADIGPGAEMPAGAGQDHEPDSLSPARRLKLAARSRQAARSSALRRACRSIVNDGDCRAAPCHLDVRQIIRPFRWSDGRTLAYSGRDVEDGDRLAQPLQGEVADLFEPGVAFDRAGDPLRLTRIWPSVRLAAQPGGEIARPCRSRCSRCARQSRSGPRSRSPGRCRCQSRSRGRAAASPPAARATASRISTAILTARSAGSGQGSGSLKNTMMPSPAKWSSVPSERVTIGPSAA